MSASPKSSDTPRITNKQGDNEDTQQSKEKPKANTEYVSEQEKRERVVKKLIKEIKDSKGKDITKGLGYNLNDSTEVEKLFAQYKTYLPTTKDGRNLLHRIATSSGMPSPANMAAFIKALIEMDIDLLAQRDEDGKTPLFCAVSKRKHGLVNIMCEAHRDVSRVLGICRALSKSNSSNCLHEAISKKVNSSAEDDELIKSLIKWANDDTLLALNENDLSPLHIAVEYDRCDEGQVGVVEALVTKCDKALGKMYQHEKEGPLSPYLYLEHTYNEAIRNRVVAEKPKSKEDELRGTHDIKNHIHNERHEGSNEEQSVGSTMIPQSPEGPRIAQGPGETPTAKFSSRQLDQSRGSSSMAVTVGNTNGDNLMSPATKERGKRSLSMRDLSTLKPSENNVENMKLFLRLYCLRNRQHDDAVEFLYDRLENGLNHLNLEDILQYVAIPRVKFEHEPVNPEAGQRTLKPNGSGRADVLPLFNWLRDKKGVKRILRVIIEDLQDPAHSDEVIESCLNKMCVETWDWRKHDLSPEVLHKVAPDVQVVHLYWGGNNAILRAWSEAEGLKKLKNLKTVHLHSQQGLETRDRTEQNVMHFKERMMPIEVKEHRMRSEKTSGTSSLVAATHDPYERHKWVSTMEEYADFLQTAERAQIKDNGVPLRIKHPITVALIDDGVDVNDQSIQSRIIGGRSFCHRDKEQNLNQSYYVSGGHGTSMAKLICKVCPGANLFILRLDEYFVDTGRRQITAESATKAIRAAIEREVDIISMSWTIEKTDRNSNDIEKLADAIRDAANKNILMFCAATDQG
ncbi:hypothetical protein O1611_g2265 [Lasiodiplodia mahajangana]|uniref:Uncharacterized protein n=1 Tax=Lasiodiplodia mahajangana TaxID=1108764 RepID=A0ACC2JV03_9PEZI|nr:hypothetical protein O1611_g2265 [Lasiodiplodia mahajangana]